MASALDSTHTVVVKTENRGLRVVIGLVAVLLWARWWWTGALLAAVAFAVPHPPESEGFNSITGTLLPIAVDMLWFVGSVVIFALTKSAAIVWDVIAGVFETFKLYSDRRAAVEAAKQAATKAGTDAGLTNAGAIAGTEAVQAAEVEAKQAAAAAVATPAPRSIDLNKVAAALIDHEKRLKSAKDEIGVLNDYDEVRARQVSELQIRVRAYEEQLKRSEESAEKLSDHTSALSDDGTRLAASIASIQSDMRPMFSAMTANGQLLNLLTERVDKLEASMLAETPEPEPAVAPRVRRAPAKPKAKAK